MILETEIRANGPGNLLAVCWRQRRAERALARRGVHFRSDDLDTVAAAYSSMTPEEFDAINGRQDWANWRTIPRALSGHVPNRALMVLDLGCGTGGSTRVLAFYCPRGSRILGYELAEPLLDIARRRKFLHRTGRPAAVQFHNQPITETFRQTNGRPWPDASVDLVNASGIIGHHLRPDTVQPLIIELRRVLSPYGIAMLDVGPTLHSEVLEKFMPIAGFHHLGRYRSWLLDPTGKVVYQASGE
jgi:SAM-dependent methyltransferase